uniref:NADH dehydrogenase subunit 4 n=1 Tax=Paranoplocephala sp. RKZ13 TaxID=2854041 RepID=UPI001F140D1D|nr:NADH dehydrogenase subunit 4 [Paranoplocephala sp. RKZ13]UKS07977.1 NADH dehydrogenase subunit 4 [Paranoplocephala sp. RKZ13]
MFKVYSFSFFLIYCLLGGLLVSLGGGMLFLGGSHTIFGEYISVDAISFYLTFLVILLGVYSQLLFSNYLSLSVRSFLLMSLTFSVFCFCINHSILFWCFYELSMLPLLYLIFGASPYSERFLAGWYFACYLLVTSVPLILILIYMSAVNNSFFFSDWDGGKVSVWLLIVLTFVFFTKVPLVPFHTWLPIVHAEATSIVSIFLSGYIMKLGLLGVYRCSAFLFNNVFIAYLCICFIMCFIFFVAAAGELDGKRWLAILSLAHIVVPFMAFFISDWNSVNFCFFYCLGHGLSAGLVFGLLWYFYDMTNTRNWLLVKASINGSIMVILVVVSLLSLCSFPPTIQFFCEVSLLKVSGGLVLYILFWCLYLFLGGLVPLVLCGSLLIRSEWVENYWYDSFNYYTFLLFLCLWCYIGLAIV